MLISITLIQLHHQNVVAFHQIIFIVTKAGLRCFKFILLYDIMCIATSYTGADFHHSLLVSAESLLAFANRSLRKG